MEAQRCLRRDRPGRWREFHVRPEKQRKPNPRNPRCFEGIKGRRISGTLLIKTVFGALKEAATISFTFWRQNTVWDAFWAPPSM